MRLPSAGSIVVQSTTRRTPFVSRASASARSRSALDRTLPVTVTTPSAVSTFRSSAFTVSSSAIFALILAVSPPSLSASCAVLAASAVFCEISSPARFARSVPVWPRRPLRRGPAPGPGAPPPEKNPPTATTNQEDHSLNKALNIPTSTIVVPRAESVPGSTARPSLVATLRRTTRLCSLHQTRECPLSQVNTLAS